MSRGTIISVGVAVAIVAAAVIVALQLNPPGRSFATIASYDVGADGQTLLLTIEMGHLQSIGYVAADEDATTVRPRVLLLHHFGTSTAELMFVDVRVHLEDPLGSRDVLDQSGRAIPRTSR